MRTDPETTAALAQALWELLQDVEANTNPDVDILRRRLVEDGYRALRRADVITEATAPRWGRTKRTGGNS